MGLALECELQMIIDHEGFLKFVTKNPKLQREITEFTWIMSLGAKLQNPHSPGQKRSRDGFRRPDIHVAQIANPIKECFLQS
jgi:hypothetical protein